MRDLAYPFSIGQQMPAEVTSDPDVVGSAIQMLFETAIGEIEGRPTYGTDLWRFVFESNLPARRSLIVASVYHQVSKFIPQASVVGVAVEPSVEDETEVIIPIAYQVATRRGVFDVAVSRG